MDRELRRKPPPDGWQLDCLPVFRLLFHSDTPIKVIASDLGFVDPSYFTKVFRRAAGESPSGFRQAQLLPQG